MTCEKERRKKENDPNDTKVPNLRVWRIQKISIFPPKINRRIVAIFWHENWITEFQIDWKICKLIHFFAKNPKLFFWILAPKMAKIPLLIFGVKIETFKVSLLDFQWKNSKILPE